MAEHKPGSIYISKHGSALLPHHTTSDYLFAFDLSGDGHRRVFFENGTAMETRIHLTEIDDTIRGKYPLSNGGDIMEKRVQMVSTYILGIDHIIQKAGEEKLDAGITISQDGTVFAGLEIQRLLHANGDGNDPYGAMLRMIQAYSDLQTGLAMQMKKGGRLL